MSKDWLHTWEHWFRLRFSMEIPPVRDSKPQTGSSATNYNISLSRMQGRTLHWVFADTPAFNCHMHRLGLWFRKTVGLKQATGEFYLGNTVR